MVWFFSMFNDLMWDVIVDICGIVYHHCLSFLLKIMHFKIIVSDRSTLHSSHFEWRVRLSDTILKGDHTRTIPVTFALIWFSGFRGEDLNVISYQNNYEIKITSKSFPQKFELKWTLGGPLSKLCVTPPFSINFRCQIENQESDYRLLEILMWFLSHNIPKQNKLAEKISQKPRIYAKLLIAILQFEFILICNKAEIDN
jgi:hypothetical protein